MSRILKAKSSKHYKVTSISQPENIVWFGMRQRMQIEHIRLRSLLQMKRKTARVHPINSL